MAVDEIMTYLSFHLRAHFTWEPGEGQVPTLDIRAMTGIGAIYATLILDAIGKEEGGERRTKLGYCDMCGDPIIAPEGVQMRSSRKYCYKGWPKYNVCATKTYRHRQAKKVQG